MNVLISGGGTGGHVYPALAVAPYLDPTLAGAAAAAAAPGRTSPPAPPAPAPTAPKSPAPASATAASAAAASGEEGEVSVANLGATTVREGVAPVADALGSANLLWVGSEGGMEQALVERAGIPFRGISTGQLRGANPFKLLRNAARMVGGTRQSLAIIDRFRPDACFVTGGYVCGPVVAACSLRKVPVLIYLPDMTPGYAIRLLSKMAQRVAVTLPEAAAHFGGEAPAGKAVVTGYPVRRELLEAAADKPAARRRLGALLQWPEGDAASSLPLLLVWGGSQGARAINRAAWGAVAQLLPHAAVLHVVGERDWPLYEQWAKANPLPAELAGRYHPVPYLHETMPLALAAADLTVARAGASSLGEFPAAGLPAVLAPYAGVNQMDNAQALASRGAAVIVRDEELEAKLLPTVVELLTNPGKLRAMGDAMRQLARPQAAGAIAAEIMLLAHGNKTVGA